jgi:hypothetical protein
VASCGGGDSDSKTSAASGASGPQAATGAQRGPTGKAGATGKSAAAGSGAAGGSGSRAKRAARRPSSTQSEGTRGKSNAAAPRPSTPGKGQPQPYRLTEEQARQVAPAYYREAYTVCRAYTLEVLARDLKVKSRDPEVVARAYAASWAEGVRKAVAAGCKKGLVESR